MLVQVYFADFFILHINGTERLLEAVIENFKLTVLLGGSVGLKLYQISTMSRNVIAGFVAQPVAGISLQLAEVVNLMEEIGAMSALRMIQSPTLKPPKPKAPS